MKITHFLGLYLSKITHFLGTKSAKIMHISAYKGGGKKFRSPYRQEKNYTLVEAEVEAEAEVLTWAFLGVIRGGSS